MFRFLSVLTISVLVILSQNAYAQTSIDLRGNVGGSGIPGGSIIPGYDNRACGSTIAGAIRYNSASSCAEFCNGSDWICPGGGSAEPPLPPPTTCAPQDLEWSIETPANGNDYRSVAYGDGIFTAVSWDGTHSIMTSEDGITWDEHDMGTGLFALDYGNGRFVAIQTFSGGRTAVVSEDGETWDSYPNALPSGGDWRSVVYGDAGFVAVDGESTSRVAISPDGINWTAVNVEPDVPGGRWTKIAYGNGRYAAIRGWGWDNTGPGIMTSTDGTNWVGQAATDECGGVNMTYGASGGFVSAGCWQEGWLTRSTDGITWIVGGWSGVAPEFNNVSYGEDIGYVGISNSHVYYSTDGVSWAREAAPAGWSWLFDANASAYGNGTFVAVRENGVLRGVCPE